MPKPVAHQAGLILVTSVVLGLAYNRLNPVGLRWSPPPDEGPIMPSNASTAIYSNEVILARPVPASSSRPPATQPVSGMPVATRPVAPQGQERPPASATRTTWEKIQSSVEAGEVVLVDSRPQLTYEARHIPRAVNLPEREVASRIGTFRSAYPPSSTRLVIYCSNANCSSAAKLASILTQQYGYTDVQYVPGGYLDWLRTRGTAAK